MSSVSQKSEKAQHKKRHKKGAIFQPPKGIREKKRKIKKTFAQESKKGGREGRRKERS